jgi:hypothetical protein
MFARTRLHLLGEMRAIVKARLYVKKSIGKKYLEWVV